MWKTPQGRAIYVKMSKEQLYSESIDKSDRLDKNTYYWLHIIMTTEDTTIVTNVESAGVSSVTRVKD
jgi:hypothetical protein